MHRFIAALVALAVPGLALAHGGGAGTGFLTGLGHPVGGLDHMLAMVAVGLWAAQAGGRARWAVPAAFVGVMALGGLAGIVGLPLPGVELGIAGSVLAFGLLVAFARRLPLPAGLALTAAFALFHGHAHGTEMAAGGSVALYAAGFMLATAALHGVGVLVGEARRHALGAAFIRIAGAGTVASGALMLHGAA